MQPVLRTFAGQRFVKLFPAAFVTGGNVQLQQSPGHDRNNKIHRIALLFGIFGNVYHLFRGQAVDNHIISLIPAEIQSHPESLLGKLLNQTFPFAVLIGYLRGIVAIRLFGVKPYRRQLIELEQIRMVSQHVVLAEADKVFAGSHSLRGFSGTRKPHDYAHLRPAFRFGIGFGGHDVLEYARENLCLSGFGQIRETENFFFLLVHYESPAVIKYKNMLAQF